MKTLTIAMLLFAAPSFAGQAPATATGRTAAQGAAPQAPAFAAKKLTRAEFDKLLAKPDQLLLIDLRRPDEVAAIGGLPVFLTIPIADLEKSLAWIPKDRTIVTLSNHAARGGRAADVLTKHGFKVAGTVGVQNYEADGGTLFKQQASKAVAANRDGGK
jgi:rhodanese-related sulfurtransferase